MIFRLKQHLGATLLIVTLAIGAGCVLMLRNQVALPETPALRALLLIGIAGAALAVLINGILHGALTLFIRDTYARCSRRYRRVVMRNMRWPHYIAGGLFAGCVEEPIFRGLIQPLMPDPTIGIVVTAFVFAACHWLHRRFLGFWLWAFWEGILFGMLYSATGSLIVPMIAHTLHDILTYAIFGWMGKGQRSQGAMGLEHARSKEP